MRQSLTYTWRCFLTVLVFFPASVAMAHHGGLGIEGDLVEWALKLDQWQDEKIDQGQRIKFLSYPRQPIRAQDTRLVFEIQSAITGRYVSGLTPQLDIKAPDGTVQQVPLPETTGVTAYYETRFPFAQIGEHSITFQATVGGVPFQGTFQKTVSGSAFFGEWPVFVGHLAVFVAFAVTWIGMVMVVQQRFARPPRRPLQERIL